MFGRLAMGFANVRAGTRVLMLVLVRMQAAARGTGSVRASGVLARAPQVTARCRERQLQPRRRPTTAKRPRIRVRVAGSSVRLERMKSNDDNAAHVITILGQGGR